MRGYEELQRNLQQEISGLLQRNRELAKLAEEKQEKEGALTDSDKQKPQVQLDSPEGPPLGSGDDSELVTHVLVTKDTLLVDDDDENDEVSSTNWDPNHEPLSGIQVHHVNGALSSKLPPSTTNSGSVNSQDTSAPSSLSQTQSSEVTPSSSSSSTSHPPSTSKDPNASVGNTMQSVPISSSNHPTDATNVSSSSSSDEENHSPPGIRITDSIKLLTHPVQPVQVHQGVAAAMAPVAALARIGVTPVVSVEHHAADNSQSIKEDIKSGHSISSTTDSNSSNKEEKGVTDNTGSHSAGGSSSNTGHQTSAMKADSILTRTGSTEEELSVLKEIREMGDKQKSNDEIDLARKGSESPEMFTEENPAYSSPSHDASSHDPSHDASLGLVNGLVPPSTFDTTLDDSGTGETRQTGTGRYMGK